MVRAKRVSEVLGASAGAYLVRGYWFLLSIAYIFIAIPSCRNCWHTCPMERVPSGVEAEGHRNEEGMMAMTTRSSTSVKPVSVMTLAHN